MKQGVKGVVTLHRSVFLLIGLLALLVAGLPSPEPAVPLEPIRPYGIAVIGDPHLPGNHLPAKEALIRTIDGWEGIDRVVVLGDICSETGTVAEYAFAKKFFARLHKPLRFVTGNHDYLYEDEANVLGRKAKASPEVRSRKLKRFTETFGMSEAYSYERLGNYLLIYLSPDDLFTDHLTQFSDHQLGWLQNVLESNRSVPTLIFSHAPLSGTLLPFNERVNTPNFVAQPAERIRELILAHPQIFLYVSGHMHVPATNESFASPVNLYEGRVTNIHNTDLQRKWPWTNVLYLYPDKVVIRTYDHMRKSWLSDLERTIIPPR
jgi:predicted MPP superfamily phosphohydrolase